jgi:periplasmic protein TonB
MSFGRLFSKRTFIAVSVSLGINLVLARLLFGPPMPSTPPQNPARFTLQTVVPPRDPAEPAKPAEREKPSENETQRDSKPGLPARRPISLEAVLLPSTDGEWPAVPSLLTGHDLFAFKGGVPTYGTGGSLAGAGGTGGSLGGTGGTGGNGSATSDSGSPELLFYPDLSHFYPLAARRKRLSGRTVLGLGLDASGAVTHVEVVASSPPGVFNQAAQRAAMRVRYRPAQQAGKARPSRVRLELLWQLDA